MLINRLLIKKGFTQSRMIYFTVILFRCSILLKTEIFKAFKFKPLTEIYKIIMDHYIESKPTCKIKKHISSEKIL